MYKNLKVAQFSFGDNYGAFTAAYELHKQLLAIGVKSTLFVRNKTRDDNSVVELGYCNSIEERLLRLIDKNYFDANKINPGIAPIHFDCLGLDWDEHLEKIMNKYDIFHLHWVAGFLSIKNIEQLIRLKKPIIWTMHDFHPFTGGCHFPELCHEYENECSNCWELKKNDIDITKYILLEIKRKYSSHIQLVTASNELKHIVQRSSIFQDNACEIIPIGIDTNCFRILDKKEMKQKFRIPVSSKVILVGAQALDQNVKGYTYLKKILTTLVEDELCKEMIEKQQLVIVLFGNITSKKNYDLGVEVINVGFIQEREKMCELYNAADMFIFPSIQDTFGMTAVEAMACGVPVLAFNVNAMKEVIIPGVNGYKVEKDDYISMVSYIINILKYNPINPNICRQRIVDKYSLECVTKQMVCLYQKVQNRGLINEKSKGENENNTIKQFVQKCAFEILVGNNNIYTNRELQNIFLEYSPEFVSPEQKVKLMIAHKIINQDISIYIYGAGEFGKRTLQELEKNNIDIKGFLDKDNNKIGQFIEKYSIEKLVEKDQFNNAKIIIAGSKYLEMINCLQDLGYIYREDFY